MEYKIYLLGKYCRFWPKKYLVSLRWSQSVARGPATIKRVQPRYVWHCLFFCIVPGGYHLDRDEDSRHIYELDIRNQMWKAYSSIPRKCTANVGAFINRGYLHVVGGHGINGGEFSLSCERYANQNYHELFWEELFVGTAPRLCHFKK